MKFFILGYHNNKTFDKSCLLLVFINFALVIKPRKNIDRLFFITNYVFRNKLNDFFFYTRLNYYNFRYNIYLPS